MLDDCRGPLVLDLQQVGLKDTICAGSKLARLGELGAHGWRVPAGYVITVAALQMSVKPSVRRDLERLLERLPGDAAALAQVAEQARGLIVQQPLAGWLAEAVSAAHERLVGRVGAGPELLVAVRSSARSEDAAAASFAGQFDTYLGIRGTDQVLEHVRKCWASLFTARAIDYRRRHGLPACALDLAVGVMELVEARCAGVIFTLDPVTGNREHIVIEASWGLGESVVSGRVTPDQWVVERGSGRRIVRAHTSLKQAWSVHDPARGGVVQAAVPAELQAEPCLFDHEIAYLASRAVELEAAQGVPQDIEWAIDQRRPFPDNVVFLQHRPETSWSVASPPPPAPAAAYDPVQYALSKVFKVSGR